MNNQTNEPVEQAWLVEAKTSKNITVYLNLFGWTPVVNEAMRFSRKDDSDSVIRQLAHFMPQQINNVKDVKSCEHQWGFANNTITITESEYAKLKADAERWQYFIETCSSETGFELTGITDASNEQINKAIDQAISGAKNG